MDEQERRRLELEAQRLAAQAANTPAATATAPNPILPVSPTAQPYTIKAPTAPAAAPAPTSLGGYSPGAAVNSSYQNYLAQLKAKPGDYTVNPYAQSGNVTQYQNRANEIYGSKPGDYSSQYQARIEQMFEQILGRGPFNYDLNADKLYQQAKDRYIQQANMGMMNSMGQAQAATGGYGNSFAQSVGQQTFDTTMQGLNDMVPQLEQNAFNRYQAQGQDMVQQLGVMQGMEDREYGKYRDQVGDWRQDYGMAVDQFLNERSFDYGQYSDQRNFDYGAYRDQVGDWYTNVGMSGEQYMNERNFDYGKYVDDRDAAFQREQWDYKVEQDRKAEAAAAAAMASGGGGSGRVRSSVRNAGLKFNLTLDEQYAMEEAIKNGTQSEWMRRMVLSGKSEEMVFAAMSMAEQDIKSTPSANKVAQQQKAQIDKAAQTVADTAQNAWNWVMKAIGQKK